MEKIELDKLEKFAKRIRERFSDFKVEVKDDGIHINDETEIGKQNHITFELGFTDTAGERKELNIHTFLNEDNLSIFMDELK